MRLGEGFYADARVCPVQRPGGQVAGGLSPNWMPGKGFRARAMSVMLPVPWALARTLGSGFVTPAISTVRPISPGRKRRLTVDSCRVLSVNGRWRPLSSAGVRQPIEM